MRLLILADDFTGAMDTGVQLSARGISTMVAVSPDRISKDALGEDYEVLSVNMETRHLHVYDAYLTVKALLEKYALPGRYVYIKTDSALRGTIGAAFAAALDVIGGPICFVPALPSLKRTCADGICYIKGMPLADSVFRNDPTNPTLKSYIPDILNDGITEINGRASLRCELIREEETSAFGAGVPVRAGSTADTDVFLFDCATGEQLDVIADALDSRSMYGLTAGCAGFAATFHRHLPLKVTDLKPKRTGKPLLIVSGSANMITIRQISFAKAQGYPVLSIADVIYDCYEKGLSQEDALREVMGWRSLHKALACLRDRRTVIIAAVAAKRELKQINDPKFHETVAFTTASLVQLLLQEANPESLAIFGGDMVAAVLKQLGCTTVQAWGEV